MKGRLTIWINSNFYLKNILCQFAVGWVERSETQLPSRVYIFLILL